MRARRFSAVPRIRARFRGYKQNTRASLLQTSGLVKLPEEVSDDQAILVSDIFPTGYFGADIAGIHAGATVAVFGCGPVGQFAIASANMLGAGRVLAVDRVESRLAMAQDQGAEVIILKKRTPSKQYGNSLPILE